MFNRVCISGNPPIIELFGANPMVLELDDTFTEPGYVANDLQDGDVTASVVVHGAVDTSIRGTYVLRYMITDSDGNAHSVTRTISIQKCCDAPIAPPTDNPPVIDLIGGDTIIIPQDNGFSATITLTGDSDITIPQGSTWTDPGFLADDTEDGDITASVTINGTVDPNVPGVYDIVYTVTDSNGNNTAVIRTVTVSVTVANVLPTITLTAGDVTQDQGVPYVEQGATAADAEDGDITADIVITGTVDVNLVGAYTLTYTVTDSAGESVSVTRIVNIVTPVVVVNAPPTIATVSGDVFQAVGVAYVEQGAVATDAEDGDITASIVTTGAVDVNTVGTYTITYSVTDSGGESVSVTRTVNIVLPVAPTITWEDGTTVDKTVTVTESALPVIWTGNGFIADLTQGAVDQFGNILQITTDVPFPTSGFSVLGTFPIVFTATDPINGLSTSLTYTLIVEAANASPTITLTAGDVTQNIGVPYVEQGATAVDAEDGDITANIVVTGTVDVNVIGSYVLTYTVTDSGGLSTSTTRTVNIVAVPYQTLSTSSPTIYTLAAMSTVPDPELAAADIVIYGSLNEGAGFNPVSPSIQEIEPIINTGEQITISHNGSTTLWLEIFHVNLGTWTTIASMSPGGYVMTAAWLAASQYGLTPRLRVINSLSTPDPIATDTITITYA